MAPRGPRPIADVLSELMARSGFARQQSGAELDEVWRETAGALIAKYTRVGMVKRGALEITVAHSTLVQELTFQKPQLLRALAARLPRQGIKDLRFRVGPVG